MPDTEGVRKHQSSLHYPAAMQSVDGFSHEAFGEDSSSAIISPRGPSSFQPTERGEEIMKGSCRLFTLDRTLNSKHVWDMKSSHEPGRRTEFGGQIAASAQVQ